MLNRKIRFHRKEPGEGIAFLFRKLAAEAIFLEDSVALLWRHLAKIAKGTSDKTATVFRKAAELPQSAHNLLSLRRRQMLHSLSSFNHAAALLGGHIVKLCQTVAHALLCLRRKISEAGLVFQGSLLLR
jgi:hypothetical protein